MRYIFRHPDALEKILEPDGLLVMNVPHLRDLKVPRSPRTWLLAKPRSQGTRRQVAKIPRRLAAWQAWQSLVFKRVDRSHSNVRFFG